MNRRRFLTLLGAVPAAFALPCRHFRPEEVAQSLEPAWVDVTDPTNRARIVMRQMGLTASELDQAHLAALKTFHQTGG